MLLLKRCCSNYQRINTISKSKQPGDALSAQGWIQNIRRLKNHIFLDVNDGSTSRKFQVVVPKNEHTKDLTPGTSINFQGCVQVSPNGNFELHADDVNVIAEGHLTAGYPFTPKQKHAPEYVREHLNLRTRVDYIAAQLRLRHRAQKTIHDFMDRANFVHINTPILTTNDSEGAGEVFTVRPDSTELLKVMNRPGVPFEQSYFDSKVFLSVSGQLHLEAAAYGLGNVYTFSPAFRAENSKSPLHLAEFYMFEAEIAFIEEMQALTQHIEHMLKEITHIIINSCAEDLALCRKNAQSDSVCDMAWLTGKWTTLSYDDAFALVWEHKHKFKTEVKAAEGFSKEQELFLVAHCGTPVFVVDWPAALKPFYMKTLRNDSTRVHALDLLMPAVGELCGGSLRENDAERLRQHPQMPPDLDWYLELRKFGGIPTGGFGMGFERYLQLLTGVKNIRDVIPFPRYPHSCKM